MPQLIEEPAAVPVEGSETIWEFVGRASTGERGVSVARLICPGGWSEPPQRPDFDEYSLVLSGVLVVDHDGGRIEVRAGQAIHTRAGERIQYLTPSPEGAEYVAVCVPAFSLDAAHREPAG
ncbi:MAG: cupin domain-containing protein [Acidimicrobiales bacterium]|nr:cupin domain-containing protein [Acidimicrobiales bacterium]